MSRSLQDRDPVLQLWKKNEKPTAGTRDDTMKFFKDEDRAYRSGEENAH